MSGSRRAPNSPLPPPAPWRSDPLVKAGLSVAGLGALHAAFCGLLAAGGHAPSRAFVPIPRESYYAAQAAFVLPLYLACWLLLSAVATGAARGLGGRGSFRRTAAAAGPAYALPLASLLVMPELFGYIAGGFGAVKIVMRIAMPLAAVAALALVTGAVKQSQSLGTGRAVAAAFAGLLAQALAGGVLLR